MGRRPRGLVWAVWLALPLSVTSADLGRALLDAATQGRTTVVEDLIAKGAALESKDKSGRTALMLAAQRGHGETVRLLLSKGADATSRDATGATAWVLAMFPSAGSHNSNDTVAKVLPRPPAPKFAVEAAWSPANLYSSCTMRLDQLTRHVNSLRLDDSILAAFRRFAGGLGNGLAELPSVTARGAGEMPDEDSFAGADAVLTLLVRPAASCLVQQSTDNLSITVDVQLRRARDRAVLLHKIFGGGLKGLHARSATNQAQYLPVYEEFMRAHLEQIYWTAVETWYRSA